MTITEKTYAVFKATAAITALVPATRIKTPGDWQNLERPFIVHRPVTADPIHTFSGMAALRMWDFYQVSIFADDYPSGEAVAVAVRDNFDGRHDDIHVFFRQGPWYVGRDPETNLEHFALDFRIGEAL